MDTIFKTFDTEIKEEADSRRMSFKISTGAVDRDGDIIEPKGWQTDAFMLNPCVLFAHDYKSLPVAKAVKLTKTDTALIAVAEFPPKGTYEFADTVYDMLKGGFLNATSVGFKPMEYEPMEKGYRHKTQQLLEFSIVPVPSNHEALALRGGQLTDEVKALQAPIATWCEKFLAALKGDGQWVAGLDLQSLVTKKDLTEAREQLLSTLEPKYLNGCPLKSKCPNPKDGHPDTCPKGKECPLLMPNQSGGGDGENGVGRRAIERTDKADVLEISDEAEHIIGFSQAQIDEAIRSELRAMISPEVKEHIQKQINYARGRV